MRFKISSADLEHRLSVLGKVVESKPSLPIWQHFLFETVGDTLYITTCSQDVSMRTALPLIECDGDGKYVVPCGKLISYLKCLPDQPIEITMSEDFKMVIKTAMGTNVQPTRSAEEWSDFPDFTEEVVKVELGAQAIFLGIQKTQIATGMDELRPVLSCICFDMEPDALTVVATDGFRLSRYVRTDQTPGVKASFILNRRPASILRSVLDKDDSAVAVEFDSKRISFTTSQYTIICSQLVMPYPAYKSLIPDLQGCSAAVVNRKDLLDAIQRVSLFSGSTQAIKLDVKANSINCMAQDLDLSCSGNDVVVAEYDGPDQEHNYRSVHFAAMLANMQCQDVTLMLMQPSRPTLILPVQKQDYEDELLLLMPLSLR